MVLFVSRSLADLKGLETLSQPKRTAVGDWDWLRSPKFGRYGGLAWVFCLAHPRGSAWFGLERGLRSQGYMSLGLVCCEWSAAWHEVST